MKMFIGNQLIGKLKPDVKSYDVWDSKLTGFILRVLPTGTMVYRCEYARGKRITLGKASVLTAAQARDRAKEILADVVKGNNPISKRCKNYTLKEFIEKEYSSWRRANRKRGDEDIYRLKARFESEFGNEYLASISPLELDRWRSKRITAGIKPITANRDIAILKALLSKAEEWGVITTNPLIKFKPLRVDTVAKVRYLTQDEETRLKQVLFERDRKLKAARERGNKWKKDRGYHLLPDLSQYAFGDYMTPMILLSLNTGLRRGELFSLHWKNINFDRAILTIPGNTAKSGKTKHVPLNLVALKVLKEWHIQCPQDGLVFSSINGNSFNNVKKAWTNILKDAEVQDFRWHDLRHHFASKLAMAAIDLNIIRELLGHADIKMTLRYAHLAPEYKAKAVAKLVEISDLRSI